MTGLLGAPRSFPFFFFFFGPFFLSALRFVFLVCPPTEAHRMDTAAPDAPNAHVDSENDPTQKTPWPMASRRAAQPGR